MKGQIISGYEYSAVDANGHYTSFGVTENGVLFRNTYSRDVQTISIEEVKGWTKVIPRLESLRIINNRVYYGTIMEHEGELYTVNDAVSIIADDDDAFRDWADEQGGYIEIMDHSFYVDYDTICNWGIEDEIKEDWVDTIEENLIEGDIDGWEPFEADEADEVEFVILDNGTVIPKEDIDRGYIASLIDAMLAIDNSSHRFGDWVVTYDPIKSEAVPTAPTAPTEATTPTDNQTTEPASNPDDGRPRITLTGMMAS